jgi:hypothetical protein
MFWLSATANDREAEEILRPLFIMLASGGFPSDIQFKSDLFASILKVIPQNNSTRSTMVLSPNGTTRNSHLLKQLAVLLLLFVGASTFLYNKTIISESFDYGVWLDHTNAENDDDGIRLDTIDGNDDTKRLSAAAAAAAAAHTRQFTNSSTLEWSKRWFDRIPPNHHASPYILYVHVGKTGGIALEKGVPIRTSTIIQILKCIVEDVSSNHHTLHEARKFCHDQVYNQSRSNLARLALHILAHKHLWSALYQKPPNQNPSLPNLMDFAMDNVDTLLVTTRNPIDRIVSAFNYHRNELVEGLIKGKRIEEKKRIQNAKKFDGKGLGESFYNCFPDVRYLADELGRFFHLLNNTDSMIQSNSAIVYNGMTCGQLAYRLLSRKDPNRNSVIWAHYTSNYRWYKELTVDKRPDVPVLVVRTEYLWYDTTNIEVALGGNSSNFIRSNHAMSHGSEGYAVTAKLETDVQRRSLCCAIYDDLQAYQDIIINAINLSSTEKEEMMALVYKDCGVHVDRIETSIFNEQFWEDWFVLTCHAVKRIR